MATGIPGRLAVDILKEMTHEERVKALLAAVRHLGELKKQGWESARQKALKRYKAKKLARAKENGTLPTA
jgi:hypothetical protein